MQLMLDSHNCMFPTSKVHITSLLYHVTFQEVHTRRKKEVESKHHGIVKELTSPICPLISYVYLALLKYV